VEAIGESKGLGVKFAQLVGFFDFAMEASVREVLSSVRVESVPLSSPFISQVIYEEFGKLPRQLFSEWESKPFAAASIGQVHLARLHSGEKVTVKVQYPGIVEALGSDLATLSLLGQLGGLIFKDAHRFQFIDESREKVFEECDYVLEVTHQSMYHEILRGHPTLHIPRVFFEFSGKKVLTTEFCPGVPLREFCEKASQDQRNTAGEAIWDFSEGICFKHGIFNADPHAENFLFHNGKVTCLDFGSVKKIDDKRLELWGKSCPSFARG